MSMVFYVNIFIYYIVFINIMTFFIYGLDKLKAIMSKRRISEKALFIMAFLGGGIGAILGMLLFRHKTKKVRFYLWNILMIIIWILLSLKVNAF